MIWQVAGGVTLGILAAAGIGYAGFRWGKACLQVMVRSWHLAWIFLRRNRWRIFAVTILVIILGGLMLRGLYVGEQRRLAVENERAVGEVQRWRRNRCREMKAELSALDKPRPAPVVPSNRAARDPVTVWLEAMTLERRKRLVAALEDCAAQLGEDF